MSILEIQDLSLTLDGNKILNDVNMKIEENMIYSIVGPNGAGKSTLGFVTMGLEGYTDFQGEILYKGESLKGLSVDERANRGITLAWQEPARFEGLTVKQFINASAAEKSGETVRSAIEKVGMDPDDYLERAMDSGLSGGERKKIELASILAMDPELVLLDEPDSGIDVESLDRIFEGIEMLKDKGATVIVITHSATVLEQTEYAFLMCCGTFVDKGKTDEVGKYFEEQCIPCDHKNLPEAEGVSVDGS